MEMDVVYSEQLRAALEGNTESLDWIMQAERPWLLALCERKLRNSGIDTQAEDLVQDCCLRLISKRSQLHFTDRAGLRAWLSKATLHRLLDIKKRRRNVGDEATVNLEAKTTDPNWPTHSRALHDLRKALPARQDTAIVLRDYLGCSFALSALVLGCGTITAARRLRSRALLTIGQVC